MSNSRRNNRRRLEQTLAVHAAAIADDKIEPASVFGRKICAALNLDANFIRSFTIKAEAGAVATIAVERYMSRGETDAITMMLKEYELKFRSVDSYPLQPVR